MKIVTQPAVSDVTANWALEIVRDRGRTEYIAAEAIEADGDRIVIWTPKGEEITLPRGDVRKILLMRTALSA